MKDVRKAARKKSKEIKNSAIKALQENKVLEKSNKELLSPKPEQNTGNTKSR